MTALGRVLRLGGFTALLALACPAWAQRILATAPVTVTLAPGGTTRDQQWATWQATMDFAGQPVTINLAPGVHTDSFAGDGPLVGVFRNGQVRFVCLPGASVLPISGPAFTWQNGAKYRIDNCPVRGGNADSLIVTASSEMYACGTTFYPVGAHYEIQLGAAAYGFIDQTCSHTIDHTAGGGSIAHFQRDRGAQLTIGGAMTFTLLGAPSYSGAFDMSDGALFNGNGPINFTACFYGHPFLVYDGGLTATNVGGPWGLPLDPTYFPSCDKNIAGGSPVTITAVAGSNVLAVSGADAARVGALLSNPGLVVASPAFMDAYGNIGVNFVNPRGVGSNTITLAAPALRSGTHAMIAGGFAWGGGLYTGLQPWNLWP
jgi:hypothetical protein